MIQDIDISAPLWQKQTLAKLATNLMMKSSQGFTLIEIITILAIIGILSAIAAPSLLFANKPLQNATNILVGHFKQIRAKAMVTTSAYRLKSVSTTRLEAEYAINCSATSSAWVNDPQFTLDFQDEELKLRGIQLVTPTAIDGVARSSPTGWSICYNSQGIANTNLIITLKNNQSDERKTLEVFPGGSVEIR